MIKNRKSIIIVAICLVLAICCLFFTGCSCSTKTSSDVYLTLVNKTHQLPESWEKTVKLDTVKNSFDEENTIEHETYQHFLGLQRELADQGVLIELDSVYRSVDDQKETVKEFLDDYGKEYDPEYARDYVISHVSAPGYSEHHTGLAVDIFVAEMKDGKLVEKARENEDMIADTEDFAKIHALLAKYGFILRYLPGKEDITGYAYEPWHLRYVGEQAAKEITEKGLTLEEYLGQVDPPETNKDQAIISYLDQLK